MDCIDELEQKIRRILITNVHIPPNQLEGRSLSAKRDYIEGNHESAVIATAKVARACELHGNKYLERGAYELTHIAKYLNALFEEDSRYRDAMFERPSINNMYILSAELDEKAAKLFTDIVGNASPKEEEKHYVCIAHCFQRAALRYALAGNIEKAKENLEKSDEIFRTLGHSSKKRRERVLFYIRRHEKSL